MSHRLKKTKNMKGWFPKAVQVPGATYAEGEQISILLFYQYVEPTWSEAQHNDAMQFCVRVGAELNLGGRMRVAPEGFNCTISGTHAQVRQFAERLRKWKPELFKKTDFKFIDALDNSKVCVCVCVCVRMFFD
jgi:predicted sulfurtransferase